MIDMTSPLTISVDIAIFLVMLAILLGFVRLAIGPSLSDRVVALDMMTVTIVAFCALYSIRADEPAFLDVAIVLALIGFVATVALARYAERRMEEGMHGTMPPPDEHLHRVAESTAEKKGPRDE